MGLISVLCDGGVNVDANFSFDISCIYLTINQESLNITDNHQSITVLSSSFCFGLSYNGIVHSTTEIER